MLIAANAVIRSYFFKAIIGKLQLMLISTIVPLQKVSH